MYSCSLKSATSVELHLSLPTFGAAGVSTSIPPPTEGGTTGVGAFTLHTLTRPSLLPVAIVWNVLPQVGAHATEVTAYRFCCIWDCEDEGGRVEVGVVRPGTEGWGAELELVGSLEF